MTQQSMKQAARRAAREVTARRRAERVAREQRIEHLAVAVLTSLREREDADRRIGEALIEMTDAHGLRLAEVIEYCDGQVSTREATRLRQAARPAGEQVQKH